MEDRLLSLQNYMAQQVPRMICIAFSGGVDSSLLLKVAADIGAEYRIPVVAVTFLTRLHPKGDLDVCRDFARELGAEFYEIPVDESLDKRILSNPKDRCYLCKHLLFGRLKEFAEEHNLSVIMDGSNYDDLKEYRPGMVALSELGIKSPLLELGFTKVEIRKAAKQLGLKVAEKPSAPCLATRLPYGTKIDFELFSKIEEGEHYLKLLGFAVVRLRIHDEITRVEILQQQFDEFISKKEEIIRVLKRLGFLYITLDLEGFRSGSMDEYLIKQ